MRAIHVDICYYGVYLRLLVIAIMVSELLISFFSNCFNLF